MFAWGNDRRFHSMSGFYKNRFGTRLQKVTIDAGFTCPNRDGSRGVGGCTYCDNQAFNPSYCTPAKSITRQIQDGIEFHKWRYARSNGYLAYFQAFSNTYAPLAVLKDLYTEALSVPGIMGLVIGTRPDCVDEEKLTYLSELNRQSFVSIEYGIESCFNQTLLRINRGHTFEEAADAIRKTASLGIHTGSHLIFGLPGESPAMMLEEAAIISDLPLNAIKFHQLQIVKGTKMEQEYHENPKEFTFWPFEDYADFMVNFLERLSPAIAVERFAGEMPPRFTIGPGWNLLRNEQVVQYIEKKLKDRDSWQGKFYPDQAHGTSFRE